MYEPASGPEGLDAVWTRIAAALRGLRVTAPDKLTRPSDPAAHWDRRDHLLTQVCGLPLAVGRFAHLHVVAAPAFRPRDHAHPAPGCYYSLLVVRADDPRRVLADFGGAALAFNDPLSQSGWNAPHRAARAAGIAFGGHVETGAHRASAEALLTGAADIAAIDVMSWTWVLGDLRRGLRIIGRTPDSPAPPFVTSDPELIPHLRSALADALPGTVPATAADYDALELPDGAKPALVVSPVANPAELRPTPVSATQETA